MASADLMRKIALSLPEVTEEPHFEKTSFRIKGKIFATITADGKTGMAKLPVADQDIFCTTDRNIVYPVANKWGEKGATFIDLALVTEQLLAEILKCAYKGIAPLALAESVVFD